MKIQENHLKKVQLIISIAFCGIALYAGVQLMFMGLKFLQHQSFVTIVVSSVLLYVAWATTKNKTKFKLDIVKPAPRPKKDLSISLIDKPESKNRLSTNLVDKSEPKLEKTSFLVITLGLAFVFMMATWCLDISISALLSGGLMTNGFSNVNPAIMYHLALYTIILIFFIMTLSTVMHLLRRNDIPMLPLFKPKPKPVYKDRIRASYGFFNMMGLVLSLPFIIMILVQIWLAYLSGVGWVRVDFSAFGELIPELIVFNAIFVIVLFIIYRQWKTMKQLQEED